MRIVVPYTNEVLDSIIYEYQEQFWPFQFVFILLSLWIVYSIWKDKGNNPIIIIILAFFWVFVAVYEIKYYNTINWIGTYVGSFFILQALLLVWFGLLKKEIVFRKNKLLLILAFLLISIPLFEFSLGVNLFELSIIGMLPNSTVLFSLILLIMNIKRVWIIFVIPSIWLVFSIYWNYLLLAS